MAPSTFASALTGSSGNSQSHRSTDWGRRSVVNGTPTSHSHFTPTNAGLGSHRDENRPITTRFNTAPQVSTSNANLSALQNEGLVYTRSEMLALFERQNSEGVLSSDLPQLYMDGWDPEHFPDNPATSAWPASSGLDPLQKLATVGADVCWDSTGSSTPLGLVEITETEKEFFLGSANPSIKMLPQNGKDNAAKDSISHRKGSILNSHHGISSPGSVRPANSRRRDTTDLRPTFSPSSGPPHRAVRDDINPPAPPASLIRRRTETRDPTLVDTSNSLKGPDVSVDSSDPTRLFSAIKRTTPGASNSPGPWSASSTAGFSPMGQFGSTDASPSPANKIRSGFGSLRGQSRFKGLMGQDNDYADVEPKREFKKSEEEKTLAWGTLRGNRAGGAGSNAFNRDEVVGSSSLLGGSTLEEAASLFGSGPLSQPQFQSTSGLESPDSRNEDLDSPSNTNPYESPSRNTQPADPTDADRLPITMPLSMLGNEGAGALPGLGPFPGLGSNGSFDLVGGDRNHHSIGGPMRDIPGFGGLSGLSQGNSMWSTTSGIGTPNSERQIPFGPPFNDGVFGAVSDFQSPMLAGLGSSATFGPGNSSFLAGTSTPGGTNHPSKLGSLFPPSMQEQMRSRGTTPVQNSSFLTGGHDDMNDLSGQAPLGLVGRPGFSTESIRAFHSINESIELDNRPSDVSSGYADPSSDLNSGTPPMSQPLGSSQAHRTMVMPDRMLWIYQDPSGKIQGPWSGLEMHDWYKAGFFTPELLVKKAEDFEFEPLATLIRRIGNSREPFLVPQVGIPHGPPTGQGNSWASGPVTGMPPFPSNFPSFGTTLTAEQQNALERRKQEEQYISARQKEHIAQQQISKQMLQNQARIISQISPTSISQPTFGLLNAPSSFPASQGSSQNIGNYFDLSFSGTGTPAIPELPTDMLNHLSLNESGLLPFQDSSSLHGQAANAILSQRQMMQDEQAAYDATVDDQEAGAQTLERLQQFNSLRQDEFGQRDDGSDQEYELHGSEPEFQELSGDLSANQIQSYEEDEDDTAYQSQDVDDSALEIQVEEDGHHPAQSPWAKVDVGPVYSIQSGVDDASFPDPGTQGPQSIDDNIDETSWNLNQAPSGGTPIASVAPWARDLTETAKGPSLREIQEAEAQKAAEQEEIALLARRANQEKEFAQATAAAISASTAPAPGLPASSTWASSGSKPSVPAPWSKPVVAASKPEVSGSAKKSLQQIQQEEEAHKQRVSASTGVSTASTHSLAATIAKGGPAPLKRYSDLATQLPSTGSPSTSSVWTTVGGSGKAKRSPVVAFSSPLIIAPAAIIPSATTTNTKAKPVARSILVPSNVTSPEAALDEVRKWAVNELRGDVQRDVSIDDFVQGLLTFPCELDVITEAVHAVSLTLDSRHYAEQFIHRRKLADKGIFESSSSVVPKAPEGWNEVARRTQISTYPAKEESGVFRVVPAKKRAGKR